MTARESDQQKEVVNVQGNTLPRLRTLRHVATQHTNAQGKTRIRSVKRRVLHTTLYTRLRTIDKRPQGNGTRKA